MKKFVYPIFEKCEKLSCCEDTGDKENPQKLALDLKEAFHRGYVNWRGRPPKEGTNPFWDDYENILADTADLRLLEPGIGNDPDSRKAESSKFGRCLAIGLLSQHYGYDWFANISNLKQTPENGWSAKKKEELGNAPDMLAGNATEFAVVEAKARQTAIKVDSAETAGWREQVENIIIEKDGRPVSFPTWLIATRYLVGNAPEKPRMLIEDPPTEGREIGQEDFNGLVTWIAKSHVVANLNRLGMYDLIFRILERSASRSSTLIWKCTHPQLDHLRFIGKSLPRIFERIFPIHYFEPWGDKQYLRHIQFVFRNFYQDGFFDGMVVDPVQRLIDGNTPQPLNTREFNLAQYPFMSLLSDGSFVAPMNIMYPYQVIEL